MMTPTPEEEEAANQLWSAWLAQPDAQQAEETEAAVVAHSLSLLAVVPPAQVEAAVVAHSLTLMMEMPPVQAGTSVLSGIASHAISKATRLQADLEAQGQKLLAWQEQVAVAEAQLKAWQEQVAAAEARAASAEAAHEATAEAAQAAALQHPRMMRLHAPGAGFMSTRDFALRLTEAGLQRERGPQTGAAQNVYHIIANASESPSLFLATPH